MEETGKGVSRKSAEEEGGGVESSEEEGKKETAESAMFEKGQRGLGCILQRRLLKRITAPSVLNPQVKIEARQ